MSGTRPGGNGGTAGAEAPRPLEGLRVLELAQNLAGPYAGRILGDLGAQVIKVERPGGDSARAWGPPFVGGAGSIFTEANRGKRSIVADLRSAEGRELLRELIAGADVLIEAFRPGAFERMGYGYEVVRGWNPRVIYCSVLAYGESGPLRSLPGYDPLMQAHGGLMSVTGTDAGERTRVGTSLVDMGTGMWLAIAVLAALRERDRTGAGTRLSTALYDTALAWNAYHLTGYLATRTVPRPMGSELPMIAPYGAFRARDGEIMIAAANDALFMALCKALGLAELLGDVRFSDNPARVEHRQPLNAAVETATSPHDVDSLLRLLREAGVPCAPIQDVAQVAADPQTEASGMLDRSAGGPSTRLPIRWAGARPAAAAPAPAAGEDGAEIRSELERGG